MLKKINMCQARDKMINKPEYIPSEFDSLVKDMAEYFCKKQGIKMQERVNNLPTASERIAMSFINASIDKGKTLSEIRREFDDMKTLT